MTGKETTKSDTRGTSVPETKTKGGDGSASRNIMRKSHGKDKKHGGAGKADWNDDMEQVPAMDFDDK
eukprot:CAMPEP_0194281890 /NCGR_PEP_ID=MMETSP0169-20130528/21826_1 /TAXON_ID=218684 /ORGANISM="Corethron pennatum, Strain L29A3" /LENGTH=66 /DNA_ID=CAMNT_0039027061 /DNA_START=158 /DNA_END=358 /DNA_ORIENTATION=-